MATDPLADLLRQLFTARSDLPPLQLTIEVVTHRSVYDRAVDALEHLRGDRSVPITFFSAGGSEPPSSDGGSDLFTERALIEGRDRWRSESLSNETVVDVAVVDGQRWWWANRSRAGTTTGVVGESDTPDNPMDDLLDPSWLLAHTEIYPGPPGVVAGRPTTTFRAEPRRHDLNCDPCPPGDELLLDADRELGILMRLTARFAGEVSEEKVVTELVLNPDVDPELFAGPPTPLR